MSRQTQTSSPTWTAAYPPGVPAEIDVTLYDNVLDLLEKTTVSYREQVAFTCSGKTLTFGRLLSQGDAFARYLTCHLGIVKGDRVAVLLPNSLDFPVCLLGILGAGAVQVSINPQYTSRELHEQLKDCGARFLIVSRQRPGADYLAGTQVERALVVGAESNGVWDGVPSEPFASAVARGAATPNLQAPPISRGDLALLQYTGGTTGPAKGAELTHGNVIACVLQFRAMLGGAISIGAETILTALPLYHIYALTVNFLAFMSLGARNVLLENPRDAEALAGALLTEGISIVSGVNTLYAGLLAAPLLRSVDFRKIKLAMGGGTAVQRAISDAWHERSGRHILEGYGMSETTCVISINSYDNPEFTASVGVPVPSTDLIILDDNGSFVEAGGEGEICVRGPQVTRGYWNKPEANAETFTGDGYLRTGDIGTIDANGLLRICDRKKDMVIVSGFNVFPNEVEGVIAELGGVAECAVTGIADSRTGEVVRAFIVRKDQALTEGEILAHCRKQLAAYKVPRSILFTDSLPKSPVGKILRRELRTRTPTTGTA